MALGQRSGARPLLLTERNGVREYQTFLRAPRQPDPAHAGSAGHRLVLQNTASTSAYLVPVMTLLQEGLSPQILAGAWDMPGPDSVGYVFARSELNIATFVHKGVVDVGAVSSVDWNDEQRMPAAFRRDFRELLRTEPYPRAVEMVRADLDPRVRDRLKCCCRRPATRGHGERCIGFWHFRVPPRRCACTAAAG